MALLPLDYSEAQSAADLDPSQVYNTGNIVTPSTTSSGSTWVNGVYQDELGCFGGNTPGYCGPKPIVRPTGDINFSYGWTDLYQVKQIANVLPYSGTGLRIDGYNFGFTAKNGNGWDDGRVDLLYAYVQFDGPKGTVYNDTANISYKYNWTRFDLAKTFTDPYNVADITSVRYGFVGKDNNYWAGPYGPEIRDVSFNLKYSVDPCVSDPMYSTSCPGYMEALAKLLPSTSTIEVTPTIVAASEPTTSETTNLTPVVVAQNTISEANSSSTPSTIEQKQEQNTEKKEGASLSTVLSIVRQEQSRIASVEQSVVSESIAQALKDADKTTAEVESIAQQSSSQSQEISNTMEAQQQTQQSQTLQSSNFLTSITQNTGGRNNSQFGGSQTTREETNFTMQNDQVQMGPNFSQKQEQQNSSSGSIEIKQPEQFKQEENVAMGIQVFVSESKPIFAVVGQTQTQEQQTIPTILLELPKFDLPIVENSMTTSFSLLPDRKIQEEIEIPKIEEYKAAATTPADDFLEPKMILPEQNTSDTVSSVKKSSQTNELAIGTKIESLAIQPIGFEQYNVALKDVPFYQPKEIYKGQKNVDNARALRQLSTDKLHQEMVEQQYRR